MMTTMMMMVVVVADENDVYKYGNVTDDDDEDHHCSGRDCFLRCKSGADVAYELFNFHLASPLACNLRGPTPYKSHTGSVSC